MRLKEMKMNKAWLLLATMVFACEDKVQAIGGTEEQQELEEEVVIKRS